MIRLLALAALITGPASGAIPTATGTAVLMPAGGQAIGVSASFAMPVIPREHGVPVTVQPEAKTVRTEPCL